MTHMEATRKNALAGGIRWSWAVLYQLERVGEVNDTLRDTVNSRPSRFTEKERIPFHRAHVERHFLLIAARNLLRALDKLPPSPLRPGLPAQLGEHVKALRDCFEHWDEHDQPEAGKGLAGKAYRDFRKNYPDEEPDAYRFDDRDTTIGGMSVAGLRSVVEPLYVDLLELEKTEFVWRGWEDGDATP